jgi:hypothetical protein
MTAQIPQLQPVTSKPFLCPVAGLPCRVVSHSFPLFEPGCETSAPFGKKLLAAPQVPSSMAVLVVIGFWPVFATLPVTDSVPEGKPDALRSLAPPF